MQKIRAFFYWLPAAGWCWLIWVFSAQPASVSGSLSDRFLWKLLMRISPAFEAADAAVQSAAVELLSYYERKAAHIFLFLVLTLLLCFALWRLIRSVRVRWWTAAGLCAVCAGLDEYHQTFVAGRSGQLKDVLVDLIGAALAIGFLALAGWIKKRRSLPRYKHGLADFAPLLISIVFSAFIAVIVHFFAEPMVLWASVRFVPDFAALSAAAQGGLIAEMRPILIDVLALGLGGIVVLGAGVSFGVASRRVSEAN